MTAEKQLHQLNPANPDFSVDKLMSSLTPELLTRMLNIESDAGKRVGESEKESEVVCRLFASGMPEDEIAIVLGIRPDAVGEYVKYNKDNIALYAKQLKGRRARRKKADAL